MQNLKFYTLPIKSLNNIMKYKLLENNKKFQFDSKGIIMDSIYYDFRVTRITYHEEPLEYVTDERVIAPIHVNQIDINQPIILCVILADRIICFKLDEEFFYSHQRLLSPQHRGNYYQLHTTYNIINDNCRCVFITETPL